MTKNDISLINSGDEKTLFRVLLTTNGDDSLFLRKKCSDIDVKSIQEDKTLQHFIKRLALTMEKNSGVGIAAPQTGIGLNLFLFTRIDKAGYPVEVAINPKIKKSSKVIVCFERDGCLSIPDTSGNSLRYKWIDVEYYNGKGKKIKERLSGVLRDGDFTSVIFQHEFDHLQGVLFIDKLCPGSAE